MSKKQDTPAKPATFKKFEAAVKQILSIPKKDFDKALESRPHRPKNAHGSKT